MRLSQAARKLNVGISTIVDFLAEKSHEIDGKPNTKVTEDQYDLLRREFQASAQDKEDASELQIGTKHVQNVVIKSEGTAKKADNSEEEITVKTNSVPAPEIKKVTPTATKPAEVVEKKKEEPKTVVKATPKKVEKEEEKDPTKLKGLNVLGKINLEEVKEKTKPKKKEKKTEKAKEETTKKIDEPAKKIKEEPVAVIQAKAEKLTGLKVLGKIELPKEKKKPTAAEKKAANAEKRKGKRTRIQRPAAGTRPPQGGGPRGKFNKKKPGAKPEEKKEVTASEIQEKIRATMAKMGGGKAKTKRSKYKREKRKEVAEVTEADLMQQEEEAKTLIVTEFISANDLASLMDVSVNEVISTCMSLGMFVSINQRLDAETITIITDEFGFEVNFSDAEEEDLIAEIEDKPEDLEDRAPVVTIMGHVDHGKTSLLDYIRDSKVTSGEAGGITQHIGAYRVDTKQGKPIAFLDTPGHEAFTAMRARGAKLTDIVILVVAADDEVMPQTKEAINHAKIAGVPIIVAINKVDKDTANPDKIKEQLSVENILVEDWGGKYQCQNVSAKTGEGIDELLDKVLLEAEMLELKANPNRSAGGAVVEASLDKGRGYLSTILVQTGTLHVGDILIAGAYHGKVKAMMDHTNNRLKEAGPSTPVQVLGLDGAPQAGDKIHVAKTEREAKEITNKRAQLLREQSVRTKKHLTLDEIGRRLAIGNFKELNLIIKGDVDGSVEALTDSLLKLSTDEIAVNIIHKGVGAISESDVLLASASDAIILGFQVRPSVNARSLADKEEIEIKHYSIIYKAIDEIKDALEGMLDPIVEEVIVGNVEVRETFKIPKIGTVAGCYVLNGHITRNSTIRIIREGIVKYEGEISALKRFKDDVTEVKHSYECGLSIKNYNDILVEDIIEVYEEREVKRTIK